MKSIPKVGDKVRVRAYEDMAREGMVVDSGHIYFKDIDTYFPRHWRKYCGHTFVVHAVSPKGMLCTLRSIEQNSDFNDLVGKVFYKPFLAPASFSTSKQTSLSLYLQKKRGV